MDDSSKKLAADKDSHSYKIDDALSHLRSLEEALRTARENRVLLTSALDAIPVTAFAAFIKEVVAERQPPMLGTEVYGYLRDYLERNKAKCETITSHTYSIICGRSGRPLQ